MFSAAQMGVGGVKVSLPLLPIVFLNLSLESPPALHRTTGVFLLHNLLLPLLEENKASGSEHLLSVQTL